MFLETVANSAVTGDITPDEKNAKINDDMNEIRYSIIS